jgi:predicted transcriptional regulator
MMEERQDRKVPISVNISESLRNETDQWARKERRNRTSVVEQALEEFLKRRQEAKAR